MPTGLDGSATVHLLPPGEYTVQVASFTCGDSHNKEYVTADGPKISLGLKAATEWNEVIDIDSHNMRVLKLEHGKFRPDSASPNCSP